MIFFSLKLVKLKKINLVRCPNLIENNFYQEENI